MKHLLIGLCLFSMSVFAETVKVVSNLGPTKSNGSGWLVHAPMGDFVVTCPHVLIPKGEVTIYLENSSAPLSGTEVWSDWARGISFVKLDAPPPIQINDRFDSTEYLASVPLSRGEQLDVEGFPSAQSIEPLKAGGQVAIVQTRRPFLPLAEGLEIINTHIELGMSCGPVFKKGTRRVVGILSNQILDVIPDRESKISSMKLDQVYANGFAVSVREIGRAFNRYLQDGPHSGDFELKSTPEDGRMIVGYGNIKFKFKEGVEGSFKVAGGTGGGVGGTGGGVKPFTASIEVTLDSFNYEKVPAPHLERYFKSWKNDLITGRPVIIDGFVMLDEKQNYVRKPFSTMEEFVRNLMQPELIPYGRINRSSEQLATVQKTAIELHEMLLKMKEKQKKSPNLLENLISVSTILSEDYGPSVVDRNKLDQTKDTSGRYAAEWVELFRDPKKAKESQDMMDKLYELGGKLGKF